ncbi:MAG: hypothetical protein B6230_03160 [Desulfobacteraceae bacterium 4572_89]|nr:MAG: hypothetical protein B6230_03160 [Desulfobacteraceae bacterium 4572_89]
MTEDLLEEIDEDSRGETLLQDQAQDTLKKKSLVKRMLGSKKKLVLVVLIVVFMAGTMAGAWFFFFKGSGQKGPTSIETKDTQESGKTALDQPDKEYEMVFDDIVEFEPFERINLKGNSSVGLVSITLSLELMDHRYRKQMYAMKDRIRKIVMGQVKEMEWLELRNPEGKIKLKYELLKQINSIFPKVMVRNIYFTEFIMQ